MTEHLDFDRIVGHIGPLGKWQYLQSFLYLLVTMSGGISGVIFAFTAFSSNHRCVIPQCESANATTFSTPNGTHHDFVQVGLDLMNSSVIGKSCERWVPELSKDLTCQEYISNLNDDSVPKVLERCSRQELVFDRSIVESSITEDFDMVCESSFEVSWFRSLLMVGNLVSSLVLGVISDTLGRSKAMILAIIFNGLSGLAAAFVKDKAIFGILRVLTGMGTKGCIMIPYVMASESTLPSHKVLIMFIAGIGHQVGEFLYAVEAYFIRDWTQLQLAAYIPICGLILVWLVVPESTRWLISKGKNEEARAILEKRAKFNNSKPIPEEMWQVVEKNLKNSLDFKQSLKAILQSPILVKRSLIVSFQWFNALFAYYGTLYFSTSLSGNPHMNFILAMLAGIPGNFLYLILPQKFGRKLALISVELVLGISCLVGGFLINNDALLGLQVALSIIGRIVSGVPVKLAYLVTAELFPTSIRNTAVGIGSIFGGFGAIFGFLIDSLGLFWSPLPTLIIGSSCIVSAALITLVPETLGQKLPETVEDALSIGQEKQ